MKYYQLISLFGIRIPEEPIHTELENVDVFFET
jgi:hypothetical protein